MKELQVCKVHGETEHVFYAKQNRWRCLKCQSEAVQRRRIKVKEMSVQYKGGKCEICGYDKYLGALDFHHLDPTQKDFGVAAKGYTRSWETIKKELDKCILVCANCHREIHGGLINVE